MHLVGNNSSMKLTPIRLGSMGNFYFFMIYMYKHCFLPLTLLVVLK